jgi:small subunit ribosomal protein S3
MASERKFVIENIRRILLKEFIRKKTERAGFGGLDIQRTPMGTRIILTAERPGMIIGRKGGTIKELTDRITEEFSFDNPRIEVHEDEEPALNPHIMAQKLASALERGWHFRRAGHSTVRRIMEAGARGCQVVISGKLTGERHRTEKFREGHIKYCGEPKKIWMKEGFAVAKKKPGVIGVKVQIMDKNARLPDEVRILTLEEKLKAEGAEVPVEGEGEAATEGAEAVEGVETVPEKPEKPAAEPEKISEEAPPEDAKSMKRKSRRKEKRKERRKKKKDDKVEDDKAVPEKKVPAKPEKKEKPKPKVKEPKKEEPPKPEPKVEKPPEPKVEKPPKPKVEKPPKPKVEKPPEPKPEPKPVPKAEPKVEKPPEPKIEKPPEPKVEKPPEPKVEKPSEPKPEEAEKKDEKKKEKKDELDDILAKLETDLKG